EGIINYLIRLYLLLTKLSKLILPGPNSNRETYPAKKRKGNCASPIICQLCAKDMATNILTMSITAATRVNNPKIIRILQINSAIITNIRENCGPKDIKSTKRSCLSEKCITFPHPCPKNMTKPSDNLRVKVAKLNEGRE